jgi:hypothetical protein
MQEKHLNRNSLVPDAVQEEITNTIQDGRLFPKTTEFDFGFYHYKYIIYTHSNYSGVRTRK